MSERKQQILQAAIDIIAGQGYGALTMRALARASDLKLGALQYHYKTRDDMLRALVGHIVEEYQQYFESVATDSDSLEITDVINFLLEDAVDNALQADRLWPQLWAMGQVEPLVADLLDEIYDKYLGLIQNLIETAGSESPRAEALCLMSIIEGSTLFLGRGRRWESDAAAVNEVMLGFIEAQYGKSA
ncbi:MAG: TetR/AcrR family transcriptional regulator [Pseudomonadales bacterium]